MHSVVFTGLFVLVTEISCTVCSSRRINSAAVTHCLMYVYLAGVTVSEGVKTSYDSCCDISMCICFIKVI